MPRNKTDAVTLMHDVDYALTGKPRTTKADLKALEADIKAIQNADNTLPGLVTQVGLTLRSMMNLPFHGSDNTELASKMKQTIKQDPYYQKRFKELGLLKELQEW
jgi:hypothetical protein